MLNRRTSGELFKVLKRNGWQFVLRPHVVLERPDYRLSTNPARALLIGIAVQCTSFNSGKLVACTKYRKANGWR
ncbi:MAG: hypothetical protein CFE40_14435 [Burkholderiales bacterium PBB1]|nr:MAG: hypothetical protein CFE40_14435 [Burkholderiales bacterium PBB1]